jgi:hypothetical protein
MGFDFHLSLNLKKKKRLHIWKKEKVINKRIWDQKVDALFFLSFYLFLKHGFDHRLINLTLVVASKKISA